jgi:hypothetical protein
VSKEGFFFMKLVSLFVCLLVINECIIQGGSNMTGTNCDLFTHKSSRSYLNHFVHKALLASGPIRLGLPEKYSKTKSSHGNQDI